MLQLPHLSPMALLVALLSASGCATWGAGDVRKLGSTGAGPSRLLVITAVDALELKPVKVQGETITGTVARRWEVKPGSAPAACGDSSDSNDSPEEIAERLGWFEHQELVGQTIAIASKDLTCVRVYDPRTEQTVVAVVTGSVLGSGATIAMIFVILLAFIQSTTQVGRPLRVRGRKVKTPVETAPVDAGWSELPGAPAAPAPVPAELRPELARIWTEEAQLEHAAIAAFSKLSLELMALGAPPALVARTHRAALDEVEHARLCFAMASAYAGHPLGPAPLREALVGDTADLRRLARESLLDGCIGEGMAAEMARLGAEHARDPEVVRVMKVQAADERSHAELSWAMVEWCLGHGGEALRRELLAALGEARMPACHDLPEHGRVGRLLLEPHFAALVVASRARLLAVPAVAPAGPLPAASRG